MMNLELSDAARSPLLCYRQGRGLQNCPYQEVKRGFKPVWAASHISCSYGLVVSSDIGRMIPHSPAFARMRFFRAFDRCPKRIAKADGFTR